ncbi:MAG: hypothetical protein LH479_06825 [Polaromonas sp.]|nr:hypothetical protein [Polaromonas sp.]
MPFPTDAKYAAITGDVWLVDPNSYAVAGRVTQIGNESCLIGTFQAR